MACRHLASRKSLLRPTPTLARAQDGAAAPLQVHEERIQGRLASAQVSVGGRSYLIVDPAAGRYDRQADNSGRRVTPVLWQLFRF
jgi:hypothetical protein